LAPEGTDNSLAGDVWLIELVGSEKLVDVEVTDRLRMVAEVKAEAPAAIGDRAFLVLDDSKVHLFDPTTGLVVPRGP
jgi:hypothetical protein